RVGRGTPPGRALPVPGGSAREAPGPGPGQAGGGLLRQRLPLQPGREPVTSQQLPEGPECARRLHRLGGRRVPGRQAGPHQPQSVRHGTLIPKGGILMSVYANPNVLADEDRRSVLNPERKGGFVNGYAHPEVLVETDWVKTNLGKPGIKLVEIDVDTEAYDAGHIPGAVGFNWRTQLQGQVRRDIISKEAFEQLVGGAGIGPQDTVILYGDHNNWFAANGFWLFKVYGHKDVRLMNGGRAKWVNEPDKGLTTERPHPKPVPYRVTQTRPDL